MMDHGPFDILKFHDCWPRCLTDFGFIAYKIETSEIFNLAMLPLVISKLKF